MKIINVEDGQVLSYNKPTRVVFVVEETARSSPIMVERLLMQSKPDTEHVFSDPRDGMKRVAVVEESSGSSYTTSTSNTSASTASNSWWGNFKWFLIIGGGLIVFLIILWAILSYNRSRQLRSVYN